LLGRRSELRRLPAVPSNALRSKQYARRYERGLETEPYFVTGSRSLTRNKGPWASASAVTIAIAISAKEREPEPPITPPDPDPVPDVEPGPTTISEVNTSSGSNPSAEDSGEEGSESGPDSGGIY
jgi:hypothetical protein